MLYVLDSLVGVAVFALAFVVLIFSATIVRVIIFLHELFSPSAFERPRVHRPGVWIWKPPA